MSTTSVTVRHVPEAVRNELAARAARSGRSLQEYLLGELSRLAERRTVADVMVEVQQRKRASGTRVDLEAILEDRDADRR